MMRKLFWCCSAAGVLVVGGLFSAAYFAGQHPNSAVSHCLTTAAGATAAMQPIAAIGTVVARTAHHVMKPHQPAPAAGAAEECVPADPQPVQPQAAEPAEVGGEMPAPEPDDRTAPIIIKEDDLMPPVIEMPPPPSTIEMPAGSGQEMPKNVCPPVMPYCTDDEDDPTPNTAAPYTDGSEKSEDGAFQEWMKFFKETAEEKRAPAEKLPPPTEDPKTEPKCQEDSHIHEHYSGCPYTGRSYPSCTPATKSGKEEVSEEPVRKPKKHGKKAPPGKGCKGKDDCPRTEGVDTMEYRKSDGGLNEYGPGPLW